MMQKKNIENKILNILNSVKRNKILEDIYRKKAVWLVDSQVLNAFCLTKC